MEDWTFAQTDESEKLAKLQYYSITKKQGEQEVEFVITVKEFKPGVDQSMRFFAQADKQTNQKTAPYLPSGWGSNLLQALSACIKEIKRFPYEG
jgi:hypothetical protein